MNAALDWLAKAVASGFFVSYPPVKLLPRTFFTGAGILGAAEGWLLMPLLPAAPLHYSLFLAAATLLSVPVCTRAERAFGRADEPRIVLDEVVGFWFAAAFLPRDLMTMAMAFVLFRIFDVFKPGPIRRLQDLPRGWGVMLDDVAAGTLASLCIHLARGAGLAYTTGP